MWTSSRSLSLSWQRILYWLHWVISSLTSAEQCGHFKVAEPLRPRNKGKKEWTYAFSKVFINYLSLFFIYETVLSYYLASFNSNVLFLFYLLNFHTASYGRQHQFMTKFRDWPKRGTNGKTSHEVHRWALILCSFSVTAPTQKMRLACACLPLQGASLKCRLSHLVGFSSVAGWADGAAPASLSAGSRTCKSMYACTYNINTFK